MRKVILSALLALAVGGIVAPLLVSHAQAGDCQHGETYDSHGSRCN